MKQLSESKSSQMPAKVREIRLLFSYGFNAVEVAQMMRIHRVTVQRYRRMLKATYLKDVKID